MAHRIGQRAMQGCHLSEEWVGAKWRNLARDEGHVRLMPHHNDQNKPKGKNKRGKKTERIILEFTAETPRSAYETSKHVGVSDLTARDILNALVREQKIGCQARGKFIVYSAKLPRRKSVQEVKIKRDKRSEGQEAILKALRKGTKTTQNLKAIVGGDERFKSMVQALRRKGYVITAERTENHTHIYTLVSEP